MTSVVNGGGALQNPAIVNIFSVGEVAGTVLSIPAGGGIWFLLPQDNSRRFVFFLPFDLTDSYYVNPFGYDTLGGWRLFPAGSPIELNYDLHGRIVQSEWFANTGVNAALITIGVVRGGRYPVANQADIFSRPSKTDSRLAASSIPKVDFPAIRPRLEATGPPQLPKNL